MSGDDGCDGLCRRIGHDCGAPGAEEVGGYWSSWEEEIVAAAGLLEIWLAEAAGPAFRVALHREGDPRAESVRELPALSPADAARLGGYPRLFPGTPQERHVLAVAVTGPSGAAADREESARLLGEDVARTLTALLGPPERPLPVRVRLLIGHLAGLLTSYCAEALELTVAAAPGGEPVGGEAHLMFRRYGGRTARLAVVPGPRTVPGDAACVLAGHEGCPVPSPDDRRRAAFRTRAACTGALLGRSLYLNNNDHMGFGVRTAAHGLDLGAAPGGADEAARAWLGTAGVLADLREEEVWPAPGAGRPLRLDAEGLAARLAAVGEEMLRGHIETTEWQSGGVSRVPEDHLMTWLMRDLFRELSDRAFGPGPAVPPLAYSTGLPFGYFGGDYDTDGDDFGCLVLFGPQDAVVLTVDARV